ncbi:MAG: hypothetical protein MMC33_007352 [Icmadophila ericetorum]|nr:hypothetical protein [Icmadophila ericetorum]
MIKGPDPLRLFRKALGNLNVPWDCECNSGKFLENQYPDFETGLFRSLLPKLKSIELISAETTSLRSLISHTFGTSVSLFPKLKRLAQSKSKLRTLAALHPGSLLPGSLKYLTVYLEAEGVDRARLWHPEGNESAQQTILSVLDFAVKPRVTEEEVSVKVARLKKVTVHNASEARISTIREACRSAFIEFSATNGPVLYDATYSSENPPIWLQPAVSAS